MTTVHRDAITGEFVIRIMESTVHADPRAIVAQVEERILQYLVDEFVKEHGKNILESIHESTIAEQISQTIADSISKQFFKGRSK